MSRTTKRRLFAVLVALLVVCSFTGGPAIAAASGSGSLDNGVDGTLDSDDGSNGSSTSGEDDSPNNETTTSNEDDSPNNETTTSNEDDSPNNETTTSNEDDSPNNETTTSNEDEEDDGWRENDSANRSSDSHLAAVVEGTVEVTVESVDDSTDAVEETAESTTETGFQLVDETAETMLDDPFGLPDDGFRGTGRARTRSVAPGEDLSPRLDADASDDGGESDARNLGDGSTTGDAGTLGTVGSPGLSTVRGGTQPLPSGVSAGAALGLGALAAAAVIRSTPLATGSAASSFGTSGGGILSSLLDKVKPFVFPLRYSRYDDSDPLEHEAREEVYEIVNETPGSYLSEVSERAGLPLSTTRHHMKVLQREKLVSGAKLRGKRRFYPAYAEGVELAAALNDDSTASIIDALARLGAASVSDLADDLGRDPSTISHHLQRLEEDDIITREREGRAVMNKLSAEARTALEPETTPRPGEAAEAVAD